MPHSLSRRVLAAVLGLALVAAACSDDGDGGTDNTLDLDDAAEATFEVSGGVSQVGVTEAEP
ncbi:MAG: hypothetical protein AAGK32_06770, partial [Actinomycetota bacterium]